MRSMIFQRLISVLIASALIVGIAGLTGESAPAVVQAQTSATFSWQQVAAPPIYRSEGQGVVVNDKLYVFGGFYNSQLQTSKNADVYDPATNTWRRLADVPDALTHTPVVADGRTIWLIGGYLGNNPGPSTDHVWKYNIDTNTWSAGPKLPAPRGAGTAAISGRKLHFYGGAVRTGGSTAATDYGTHWVLNLDNTSAGWTTAATMPNPRNHIGGAAVGQYLYAVGGQHEERESDQNQDEVDRYDPATNTWTKVAAIPVARSHISASTLDLGGRMLTLGGSMNGGAIASKDAYLYDPATNVWLDLPDIPTAFKTPVAGVLSDGRVVLTAGSKTWIGDFTNTWETRAAMPVSLGEVAGGVIGNKLYLVGQGNGATLAYNLSTNGWSSSAAQRVYKGNHHAAAVVNSKLYLFGGLDSGAGKVQIYNPSNNTWALGADMPFAAGSSSAVVINGQVYVAGGIIGSNSTDKVAKYNPSSNSWTMLASMPQARNHAAAATDGAKFYVFGGRGPGSGDGNYVANGFDTVQIYDPASNTWRSSASDSSIAALPQARGGGGTAVYHNGEFYILGGETSSGAGATSNNVYNRVDVYKPATNTWRQGATMPTARHGIFPVLIGGRIYVAGGGTKAGYSSSNVLEVYNTAFSTTPPPTSGPTISKLTLINADTDQPIAAYDPFQSGATLNLATLPSRNLNVLAVTSPASIGSVVFDLDGTRRTENIAPYAFAGDANNGTDYLPWTPSVGSHTLKATPYSSSGGNGTAGASLTVQFTVVDDAGATSPPAATSTPAPTETPPTGGTEVVARINAGGPAVTTGGVQWSADQYFNGGKAYSNGNVTQIANTSDDVLYLTEHSATSNGGAFSYAIPVPTHGSYSVRLHFAEIYWGATGGGSGGAGKRVFSVGAEGTALLSNYDINADVGPMTAVVKEFTVAVNDGTLNLDFTASVDQPKISAIEVLQANRPAATATPQPTAIPQPTATNIPVPTETPPTGGTEVVARINAGGPAVTTGGVQWSADQYFSGGKAYSNGNVTHIANTSDDGLYLTEHSATSNRGTFSYAIPVPTNGSYSVRLHFAEIYWGATGGGSGGAGKRVFSVSAEGTALLGNYDINADVGPMTAVVKEFTVAVSDGTLNLDFTASVDQPKISAIEVLR